MKTTTEQRAKLGRLKTAAEALVADMVQEFQDYPERMKGVDQVALETYHSGPDGRQWSRGWPGEVLE